MMKAIKDYHNTVQAMKSWTVDTVASCHAKNVVLGISGGTDSTVIAKLLTDSIGPDHVYGIFMPNGVQADFEDAKRAAKAAGVIHTIEANLALACMATEATIRLAGPAKGGDLNTQAKVNMVPRVRQAVEFGIAQAYIPESIVVCTANLSELMMGYFTLWADMGSFAPLGNLTKTEVRKLGLELGLPEDLVLKTPADGLSGQSDEAKMGLKYADIDDFIRNDGKNVTEGVKQAIIARMKNNEFKRKMLNIPAFNPNLEMVEE